MLCIGVFLGGVGEQVGLLVLSTNWRIRVLIYKCELHTIVNSFNVESSKVMS